MIFCTTPCANKQTNLQKTNITFCQFNPVSPQVTGGGVLGRHGGSHALKSEGSVSVVHDAAAVIRGAVSLALRALASLILTVTASLDILPIDSNVLVAVLLRKLNVFNFSVKLLPCLF